MYYYRARHYDPRTGRFISEDPIHFKGGDANLYRYVENNPLKFTDPFGLWTFGGGIGGSIGIGGGGINWDTQIVVDDSGNIGFAATICTGGVTEAAGASIGFVGSTGNANQIGDLGGTSGSVGVGVGTGPQVSGGYSWGTDRCGNQTQTAQVGIGISAGMSPIDVHAQVCRTVVIPF